MSDPNANEQAGAAKAMTAAEAANKVRRIVVDIVDGILASEMSDEQRGAIRERLDIWSKAKEQKAGRTLRFGWLRNAMDTGANIKAAVSESRREPPSP